MAEGGRSTPSFHTMQSPKVEGGCASSFFQLFQRNSSKRRFSLTSKRLPADGSDKFSRRGRSLKPEEEDHHQPVPAAAAAQLRTDEEGKRKGLPMPVAAENAQKTTSSDSRAPSPMVVCNKKVPGVVARLMGLESLPLSGIAYPRTSKNIKSVTSVDTVVSSSASYIDERRDEQQQHSESRPAAMIMMLHEFLAHDDLKSSKQSSLKAKHLGGFGKKLEVGQQQERCQDAGKKDATRQKKSSQRWSKESELSIHQDTSSRGAWDIVQQQQQPPLPERKDEKQLSIVSSHRSSSSPRQLCPALLPSKSHNQIITPSPLRSPSTHKGTARLLEAAAKILEPNMQPCIRPHRSSSSSSSSHGRKPPSPSPPPPPIVHSAVVGDPHGKNGISSRSGERVVVVASETAARKVRNTGCNSTASLSNNSSISKDLRGQAMSRTWNGRDEKEVNSARVDESSRLNGGSVSFRESSCRYDHRVGSIRGSRVDCVVLGNQLPSLSPPINQHCRRSSKAISNTKTSDSPEVNRPSSAIPKNKDATASVQKSKAESRINSYGCCMKPSSEKSPFAITASSSSSATTPDEGNVRHHQERSSMSKFSFDNQESVTTTTTGDFADSTEVPEPISPQVPVPSVPSSISPNQMLPPSNARNGKVDQRRPIEHPVVVSSVPNTLFASSELPSQSTSKSRSKHEVLTRDLQQQQQQQQPSRSLLVSPTEEATIPCQTVTLPKNRKPAPNGGKRATRVLSEKVVKLDKEAIFPKHRVFPPAESVSKANSSSTHGAQRQQGQGAHDRCAAFLETQENTHGKQGVAAGMRMISYSKLFGVHVDKNRTAASKKAAVVPTGAEITVRSALRRQSAPPRAPSRCSAKSIVNTMVAVNPTATMLRTTKTSTPPEIHQCNKIPDQQLLLETGDGRATEDALNQNTPVEFNGGCSAESPTDSNIDRFRGSTVDTAVVSSVKLESKMSVGSIIPMHRRMRSIHEVFSELPVDSDVRACPLADTCTGDATSISCPQNEPKMQLFTEGSDDLCIEDETEQWRRSLLLMGSISERQAYTNMVDSPHNMFVSGDSLETGTWSTPSVAGGSADCTPERHKHTLRSSTPSTITGEEEASEGLTPILQKWFLESSNGSALGIGEGEQPSPVSILDSPFQDEVSITPEPSLAESDRHLDEVLELHNMCGVLGIQPSSQLDEIDVVKARDTQQESSKHSGGSNLLTEEIADIREKEKIRQAILEISKFQTADLHDRLGKSQPARADEEQSFVHGILKAAQFLSHNNEEESSLKWFAPGLPLDPSLFDRLESGDTEQISIGAGGGGGGGNLNLAQMSTRCQYGALWRCDRKLLFDSINEALVTEIGYGGEPKQPWMVNDNILVGSNPTLRPPGGCSNKLVEDIYRTISKWRELASNAIDSLIDMDMNKCCRLGKWRYYEHEIRDISLEIASMLLGMILDEFVTDLAAATAATSPLENWQAS